MAYSDSVLPLIFVFSHLHVRRAKSRGIPLFTHVESFDAPVYEARLHEDLQILRLRMRLEIKPGLPCP